MATEAWFVIDVNIVADDRARWCGQASVCPSHLPCPGVFVMEPGEVRARSIVVQGLRPQRSAQVGLAEDDSVIQALSAH